MTSVECAHVDLLFASFQRGSDLPKVIAEACIGHPDKTVVKPDRSVVLRLGCGDVALTSVEGCQWKA